jgi:hypothetical protein
LAGAGAADNATAATDIVRRAFLIRFLLEIEPAPAP